MKKLLLLSTFLVSIVCLAQETEEDVQVNEEIRVVDDTISVDTDEQIMDDEKRPDQRKEEISENLKKEMKPIEILLEQVKSRADKVGIFKKHEIPKLPDNFLKSVLNR